MLCKVRTCIISSNIPVTCGPIRRSLDRTACIMFSIRAAKLSTICSAVVRLTNMGVCGKGIVRAFRRFVGPNRPLSRAAVRLANVASSVIHSSGPRGAILRRFTTFTRKAVLMTRGTDFSVNFLGGDCRHCNVTRTPRPMVSALRVSHFLRPRLGSRHLGALTGHCNINLRRRRQTICSSRAANTLY